MLIKDCNIIWVTGLSGSGKTTLARRITEILNERGIQTIMLDGDDLRKILGSYQFNTKNNHEIESRIEIGLFYSRLCQFLRSKGLNIVISTISMYKKVQDWNKENLINYQEVYLEVPLDELRKRDPKGIYKKFKLGKLSNVAGLDLPVNEPDNPRWHFKYDQKLEPDRMAEIIINDLYSSENNA